MVWPAPKQLAAIRLCCGFFAILLCVLELRLVVCEVVPEICEALGCLLGFLGVELVLGEVGVGVECAREGG
jgi:hypothetical protein